MEARVADYFACVQAGLPKDVLLLLMCEVLLRHLELVSMMGGLHATAARLFAS